MNVSEDEDENEDEDDLKAGGPRNDSEPSLSDKHRRRSYRRSDIRKGAPPIC